MSTHMTSNGEDVSSDSTQDNASSTEPSALPGSPSSTSSTPPPSRSALVLQHLTYAAAIVEGRRLLGHVQNGSTAPSQFTSAAQVKDWGYTTTPRTVFPLNHKDTWTLFKLILPDSIIDAKIVNSVHITPTTHNNIPFPDTNAWFVNIIDLTNGTLIAGSNHGSVSTSRYRELGEGERFPELMHWSDIAYLQAVSLSHVNAVGHRVPPGATVGFD